MGYEYNSIDGWLTRLKTLREKGNPNDRDILVEIEDLRQLLQANSVPEEMIEIRTKSHHEGGDFLMAKHIDNQNDNVKKQPSGGHPGDASTRTFKHVEHPPPGY